MKSVQAHRFRDPLLVFCIAFVARAVVLSWFATTRADIFVWSRDSWEYLATMAAIQHGNWGFFMFIGRTPGYSLVLAGFSSLFQIQSPQMMVWLPFQVALTALSAVLAYHLVFRLTQSRILALFSALLFAINPANLAGEVPLLSESMFDLSLVVAQLFLLRWLSRKHWLDFVVCLVSLQIMVLTRPAGEYLMIMFVAIILIYNWRLWRYALLLVVGFSLPIVAWTWHNIDYYGINTYSIAGIYNFLFYKAISTESMMTGRSPNDLAWDYSKIIEDRIGNPPRQGITFPVGNYDYNYVTNPQRYNAMVQLATEKLLQTNVYNLVKMPYTVLKQFFQYDTVAAMIPRPLQIPLTVVSLILAVLGGWRWLHMKRLLWQHILVLGMPLYFMASVAAYNPIFNIRYYSPYGVYWALLIVLGVQQLVRWRAIVARPTSVVATAQ